MKRYPAYRDSGVEWLGEVPAHWGTSTLGRLSTARCDGPFGSGIKSEHYTDKGAMVVRLQNIRAGEFQLGEPVYLDEGYFDSELRGHEVSPGDLLVAGLGDENNLLGRACVVPNGLGKALVKADCFRFRLDRSKVSPNFVALQLSAGARFDAGTLATGTTRSRIPLGTMSRRVVNAPRVEEQEEIVAFLDRETAKIDALIAAQEKLIALLAEKRQATISHAVTRGLDPDVPMKDSGVIWLGDVPAHWDSWKLRHAFGVIGSGTTPPSDEPMWYEEGTVPWVTTGELRESLITQTTMSVTEAACAKFSALRVHPVGSLAVAMYGATIGRLGILGVPATTNQACCVLSAPTALDIRFVFFWLQGFKQQLIDIHATGGGQPNINQETIASLRIPAPPVAEQVAIANHLERELAKLQQMIEQAKRATTLLRERRSALITAAVTGQIDVRGLVADTASRAIARERGLG